MSDNVLVRMYHGCCIISTGNGRGVVFPDNKKGEEPTDGWDHEVFSVRRKPNGDILEDDGGVIPEQRLGFAATLAKAIQIARANAPVVEEDILDKPVEEVNLTTPDDPDEVDTELAEE